MTSTENRRETHRTLGSLRRGNDGTPIETRHGIAYPPKSLAIQLPLLGGAFAGGPLIGGLLANMLGGVSEGGRIFLAVCFAGVFFAGYAMWAARLASLVMGLFGGKALRLLFGLLFRRTRVRDLQELLPDKDALEAFLVSSQKAAWAFLLAGILIGLAGGALAAFVDSAQGRMLQMMLVFLGLVLWGYLLGWLGRHGYLPMPEPQE